VIADRMLADEGELAGEPEARGFAEEFTDRLKRLQ
jgi:hypothetical protein